MSLTDCCPEKPFPRTTLLPTPPYGNLVGPQDPISVGRFHRVSTPTLDGLLFKRLVTLCVVSRVSPLKDVCRWCAVETTLLGRVEKSRIEGPRGGRGRT